MIADIIPYFKKFAPGKLGKNFGGDKLKALILSRLKNIDFNYKISLAYLNEKILFHLRQLSNLATLSSAL